MGVCFQQLIIIPHHHPRHRLNSSRLASVLLVPPSHLKVVARNSSDRPPTLPCHQTILRHCVIPMTLCHVLSVCWFGTVPSSHDGFTFTPDRFFLSAILQSLTMYGYGWRCTVKCFTVREIFIKFYEIFQEPLSKYFVPNIFFSEYFATPVTLL